MTGIKLRYGEALRVIVRFNALTPQTAKSTESFIRRYASGGDGPSVYAVPGASHVFVPRLHVPCTKVGGLTASSASRPVM
jgi:hypothetical protein